MIVPAASAPSSSSPQAAAAPSSSPSRGSSLSAGWASLALSGSGVRGSLRSSPERSSDSRRSSAAGGALAAALRDQTLQQNTQQSAAAPPTTAADPDYPPSSARRGNSSSSRIGRADVGGGGGFDGGSSSAPLRDSTGGVVRPHSASQQTWPVGFHHEAAALSAAAEASNSAFQLLRLSSNAESCERGGCSSGRSSPRRPPMAAPASAVAVAVSSPPTMSFSFPASPFRSYSAGGAAVIDSLREPESARSSMTLALPRTVAPFTDSTTTLTSSFGKDAAMLALEDRVDSQGSLFSVAERTLRQAVARLEARINVLEHQGILIDESVSKSRGASRAVSEQVRALTDRVDRAQEFFGDDYLLQPTKLHQKQHAHQQEQDGHQKQLQEQREQLSSFSSECNERLIRLESEHEAACESIRLIHDHAEEAWQQGASQLSNLERKLDKVIREQLVPLENQCHQFLVSSSSKTGEPNTELLEEKDRVEMILESRLRPMEELVEHLIEHRLKPLEDDLNNHRTSEGGPSFMWASPSELRRDISILELPGSAVGAKCSTPNIGAMSPSDSLMAEDASTSFCYMGCPETKDGALGDGSEAPQWLGKTTDNSFTRDVEREISQLRAQLGSRPTRDEVVAAYDLAMAAADRNSMICTSLVQDVVQRVEGIAARCEAHAHDQVASTNISSHQLLDLERLRSQLEEAVVTSDAKADILERSMEEHAAANATALSELQGDFRGELRKQYRELQAQLQEGIGGKCFAKLDGGRRTRIRGDELPTELEQAAQANTAAVLELRSRADSLVTLQTAGINGGINGGHNEWAELVVSVEEVTHLMESVKSHSDAIAKLQSRLGSVAHTVQTELEVRSAEATLNTEAITELRNRLQASSGSGAQAPIGRAPEIEVVDQHSEELAELRGQIRGLPNHDQVSTALCELQSGQSALVDLRLRLVGSLEGTLRSVSLHTEDIVELRKRVDGFSSLQGKENLDSRALAEVRERVAECTQQLAEHLENIENLQKQCTLQAGALLINKEYWSEQSRSLASCKELCNHHGTTLAEIRTESQKHAQVFQDLHSQLERPANTNKDVSAAECLQDLGKNMEIHSRELQTLRELVQCEKAETEQLSQEDGAAEGLRRDRSSGSLPPIAEDDGVADEEVVWASADALSSQLGRSMSAELKELHDRCNTLQDGMEQRDIALHVIEQQLPEAMEKVELALGHSCDRSARIEEHDVRLNLALGRLGVHEAKLQGCMDRVDRMPTSEQVRSHCSDYLYKQLAEADMEGLTKKVIIHGHAIEELGDGLQHVRDEVAHSGARTHHSPRSTAGIAASSEVAAMLQSSSTRGTAQQKRASQDADAEGTYVGEGV